MKTKKVGALLLAGALVTMGGVYAAWTYGASSSGFTQRNLDVALTEVSTQNARGTLEIINADMTKAFQVDQMDGNYNGKLICSGFTFKFTPSAGSDSAEVGTPARVSFRFDNKGTYNGADIFRMDNITHAAGSAADVAYDYFSFVINPVGTTGANYNGLDANVDPDVDTAGTQIYSWTKDGDAFVFTLSGEIVAQHIKLNDVQLKTYEEYSAFSTALKSVDVQLRIADLKPAAGS